MATSPCSSQSDVHLAHACRQLTVVVAQLDEHVVRRDELRIIVRGPLQAGDVPD